MCTLLKAHIICGATTFIIRLLVTTLWMASSAAESKQVSFVFAFPLCVCFLCQWHKGIIIIPALKSKTVELCFSKLFLLYFRDSFLICAKTQRAYKEMFAFLTLYFPIDPNIFHSKFLGRRVAPPQRKAQCQTNQQWEIICRLRFSDFCCTSGKTDLIWVKNVHK